jgi:nucleoside triphosphate pyrophosphatase
VAGAIVLASASPRRRALLSEAGLSFVVRPADVDEGLLGDVEPEAAAVRLAERKALAAARALEAGEAFVLAADTVVAVERPEGVRRLEKPADARDAARMLRWLSGTRHRVVTGVCVLRAADGALARGFERTFVSMRAITPQEIEAYVTSGEWRDKAGGYAIQETADRFVTQLEEGGFDNVVGLPVALALRLLGELGAPV